MESELAGRGQAEVVEVVKDVEVIEGNSVRLEDLDDLDILDYLGSVAATCPVAASRIAPNSVATSLRVRRM